MPGLKKVVHPAKPLTAKLEPLGSFLTKCANGSNVLVDKSSQGQKTETELEILERVFRNTGGDFGPGKGSGLTKCCAHQDRDEAPSSRQTLKS